LSDFKTWDQLDHCEQYLLYPENVGPNMAIDEVSLNDGDFVTVVSNRNANGRKGKIAAIIEGTKVGDIDRVLDKLPPEVKNKVSEITMDMATNMSISMRHQFEKATQVVDRFHVVRLIQEALQHLRVKHRWEAIDQENEASERAAKRRGRYVPKELDNGDTLRQLLARSRGLLYKTPDKWTSSQEQRAAILFNLYPDLKVSYNMTCAFRSIYELPHKDMAKRALLNWVEKALSVLPLEFKSTISSIIQNLRRILAFFDNRSTNGPAESLNAQLKSLRLAQKGVNDRKMFLYRIQMLYA
jgi:transposase